MLGHNSAGVSLMKQRTKAMTACVPGPAEMSWATAVGLLFRCCRLDQARLWLQGLDIDNYLPKTSELQAPIAWRCPLTFRVPGIALLDLNGSAMQGMRTTLTWTVMHETLLKLRRRRHRLYVFRLHHEMHPSRATYPALRSIIAVPLRIEVIAFKRMKPSITSKRDIDRWQYET